MVFSLYFYFQDVQNLGEIGKYTNFQPVCFVRVPPLGSRTVDTDPPDGAPHSNFLTKPLTQPEDGLPARTISLTQLAKATEFPPCRDLYQQLCRLGYLPSSEDDVLYRRTLAQDYFNMESMFIECFNEFPQMFTKFSQQMFQSYLVNAATVLNYSHTRCLKMFILSAFDMARDMLITPRKLEFVREKEEELYKSLLAIAVSKIDEIRMLISQTIKDISEELEEIAANYDFSNLGKSIASIKIW